MALYALDDADDAYHVARDFLTGIDRWTWLKLAVVVFFVGGVSANFGGSNVSGADPGPGSDAPPVDVPPVDFGSEFWLLVGGVVVVGLALLLVLLFVSAVMEFVFVESLRTEVVSVREYWGQYWRTGARLFGFRLVLDLIVLAPFVVLAAAFLGPLLFDTAVFGASLLPLLALLPVILFLVVFAALVNGFTTEFVVPIMILEDRGVLDGWRRLWPAIRSQWKQFLAYVVARFVISLVVGIVAFAAVAVLVLALLVPFGVLFVVGFGLLMAVEPVGIAWLAVTGLLFGLAVIVVATLVQVPVQTYLRYYALLVLGDVEAAFDVVPEQRADVRAADDEEGS